MSLSKSESDVILNRANVALARSQRLVASWLPAQADDELAAAKSEEELQREEEEIFTAVPETLGIGAPLPEKAADGSWNRTELSSNDKLRKQLLGKNYERIMKASQKHPAPVGASAAPTKTAPPVAGPDVDEDDDEGRAALVGKKRKLGSTQAKKKGSAAEDNSGQDHAGSGAAPVVSAETPKQVPAKSRKKATSYLDEILATRSKKRKNK
ncbi:hypothetical protein N7492_003940 [Penicillium capsulatum]|uniref:Uncharacterized protein n=1 Tax=Penicillium capsulatum TaxID=69766 RepID=A0A9W9LX13_9EURO|nr:hypothetical protein N7492_003940 [Penicillium capsulatum]KAJ6121482.1 hypothetical protein N7512_003947 [Penicillium capsulatum]